MISNEHVCVRQSRVTYLRAGSGLECTSARAAAWSRARRRRRRAHAAHDGEQTDGPRNRGQGHTGVVGEKTSRRDRRTKGRTSARPSRLDSSSTTATHTTASSTRCTTVSQWTTRSTEVEGGGVPDSTTLQADGRGGGWEGAHARRRGRGVLVHRDRIYFVCEQRLAGVWISFARARERVRSRRWARWLCRTSERAGGGLVLCADCALHGRSRLESIYACAEISRMD